MNIKPLLSITALSTLFASTMVTPTTVFADSSMYPPSDLFNSNIYPPQARTTNTWNRSTPVRPPAPMYGQQNYQMPVNPGYTQPQFGNNYQRYAPSARMPSLNRQPAYSSNSNNFPFSGNNMPFNNFSNGNNAFPFSGGNMPFMSNGNNNPFGNMFGNNSNNSYNKMPFFGNTRSSNRKKAWGEERHIWPDFYTDFTDDAWDSASSGPRDLGVMPGGWRFPHISTPDPVTVSDAITNQFPPIAEEAGNMLDISEWGMFDNK